MKTMTALVIAVSFLFAAPAFAKKPAWAGKGNHSAFQHENQRREMSSQPGNKSETAEENLENAGEVKKLHKKGKEDGEAIMEEAREGEKSGLEKQKEMKSEQEQKELDKGSEKGKESRQKRKKWWKFGE